MSAARISYKEIAVQIYFDCWLYVIQLIIIIDYQRCKSDESVAAVSPCKARKHLPQEIQTDLFHYVFKIALIHGQLVSCRTAGLFAAISARPSSACLVAASKESKTRFAK